MCGIAGYVLRGPLETGVTRLTGMLGAMAHRGPDDEGLTLFDPESGARQDLVTPASARDARGRDAVGQAPVLPHRIALGHRRFSIIDLSAAAHQPFCSRDGRVWAAFNGEIYNYVEVRRELAGRGATFATDSDTEVLVEAYRAWGVECFRRFNGFWALTLFDAARGEVLLARDRIGKAPLYLARTPEGLFWASEIKGLMAGLGRGAFTVDAQAVDDFVVHGWRDLFDQTFYRGIVTFPAASHAWVRPGGEWSATSYWDVPRRRRTEREVPIDEAAARLRELLADAVRIRLRADVPVGLDLSGGMDSSSIVALATHERNGTPLRVFTLSYPGSAFDELPWADKVFDRYRDSLVRTVLEPTNEDFLASLDGFVGLMDEPFHDLALLGHQNIWRSMRDSGIRVSLNGAAGDEALAGYGSDYFEPYLRQLARTGRVARFVKEFFSYSEHQSRRPGVEHLRLAYHLLPDALRPWRNPAMEIPQEIDPYRPGAGVAERSGPSRDIEQLLIDHMTHWRMNYWCRSGNQNSMGVPLEFRCPFLDHELVEYAFSLPMSYLIRDGWLKWILRKAMALDLPPEITWRRRKMGNRYPMSERLPHCKEPLLAMLAGLDCPWLDLQKLDQGFAEINRRHPGRLWRLLSLGLWWKKCVQGESLTP